MSKKTPKQQNPIWSADGILLNQDIPIGEIREYYRYKGEFYKTEERVLLEKDRDDVEYIMKKFACLSRQDRDWRANLKLTGKVDEHGFAECENLVRYIINYNYEWRESTGKECGYLTIEKFNIVDEDGTYISFNQAYFNTKQDAQKCLDYLLEKYGKDRLKEIFGVKK